MKPIRTVIVDDEQPARENIRKLLEQHDGVFQIVRECDSGTAFKACMEADAADIDVVFLDIQMPGMTGMQALRELEAAHLPEIVFITAYEQYAVDAFEVHALDYLVKPFSNKRFADTAERILVRLRSGTTTSAAAIQQAAESIDAQQSREERLYRRITVQSGSTSRIIPVEEIAWIEGADYYVILHTSTGRHVHRESLTSLENHLDPATYVRIHRSYILNLNVLLEVIRDGNSTTAVLRDGTRLPVSRRKRTELLKTHHL